VFSAGKAAMSGDQMADFMLLDPVYNKLIPLERAVFVKGLRRPLSKKTVVVDCCFY